MLRYIDKGVAPMAKISSVTLTIVPNEPTVGQAQVNVVYALSPSGDDTEAERSYHEMAQLFSMGTVVPNGTISGSVVMFTANEPVFPRTVERRLAMADLRANVSPLQDAPIVARVTLTPLPSRDSNTVQLPAGGIGPP
jgi:hypothetical protein